MVVGIEHRVELHDKVGVIGAGVAHLSVVLNAVERGRDVKGVRSRCVVGVLQGVLACVRESNIGVNDCKGHGRQFNVEGELEYGRIDGRRCVDLIVGRRVRVLDFLRPAPRLPHVFIVEIKSRGQA